MRFSRFVLRGMLVLVAGSVTAALSGSLDLGAVFALIMLSIFSYLSWEIRSLGRRADEQRRREGDVTLYGGSYSGFGDSGFSGGGCHGGGGD